MHAGYRNGVRFYPDIPSRRTSAIAKDLLVLLLLVAFAWLGFWVHDAVDRLASLGEGVQETGASVRKGFETAADAVDRVPLVGDAAADGFREAGEETGGNVAELGDRGERGVHRLANLLGVLVFALPAALLLLRFVPERVGQVRRLTAAARVLREPDSLERRRVVAMRAAFSLPYARLLEHTPDPFGDLAAERYDALVSAALEDAGLRGVPRR
jgi:hypothetical protein